MLKMDYLPSHVSKLPFCNLFAKLVSEITDLLPTIWSAQLFSNRLKQLDISLLIETIFVTIAAILAIAAFNGNPSLSGAGWFITPGTLVAAAIIPTAIKKRRFAKIGFNIKQIRYSLSVLGWTCIFVFPAIFFGCSLLRSCGLNLPLRPVLPEGQNLAYWIFYQFMYVAVAEEVFFRGYVQGNILRLIRTVESEQYRLQQSPTLQSRRRSIAMATGRYGDGMWISILLSAACFAAAHIIVQGQIISVWTFLPGLILGWLFIRTKSLLAPILFHGLANICYFMIAIVLA